MGFYAGPMGWYTSGPGSFSYKYGNVLAAARACKLGLLTMVPRLVCVDENDDIFENHEFLGPLQQQILANKRPWKALPFDLAVDDSGESIRLPDRDFAKMLRRIGKVVLSYRKSIVDEIRAGDPDAKVVRMSLGAEAHWKVEREEWEALLQWVNGPLSGSPISIASLSEGSLNQHGEYEPPKSLEAAFGKLGSDRTGRHLVATGLGHALAVNEDFCLYQPEDDSQADVWESDGEDEDEPEAAANQRCVFLWKWTEIALLDLLVQALGMPSSVRDSVFYLHPSDVEIELPPEEELPEAQVTAGMRASTYVAQKILVALPAVRALIPDMSKPIQCGWHPSATIAELTAAAEASGAAAISLRSRLAPAGDHEGVATTDRLQAMAEVAAEKRDRQFAAHILTGTGAAKGSIDGLIVVLLTVLGPDLDLPEPMHRRLVALLERAAKPAKP
jgi:hypothetical protein